MFDILHQRWRMDLLLSVVIFMISACAAPTPTEQRITLEVEINPTLTLPPLPTATEPVEIVYSIILLADPNSDPQLNSEVEAVLRAFAGETGMLFENRPSLEISNLPENLRLVVALNPISNVGELAAAAPRTAFVAIGISGLQAGGNLTVIGGDGMGIEDQGFIAGYTAAVITEDWRVAVISRSDTSTGQQTRQSFMVGVRYFCGLCLQVYPPFYEYPLFAELPVSASPEEWRIAAAGLLDRAVKTIYVATDAGDSSLLDYLAQSGVLIIGSSPPPENLRQNWVATIQPDIATLLQDVLPGIFSGQDGSELPISLSLQEVNSELLSAGRLEHVEAVLVELLAGFISPFEP
ncbi:MAG: hypothetical protein FVQ83_14690 [Chloroflexi bacterium]|nr:hypothetical protein [Chloroflexota bacterium]